MLSDMHKHAEMYKHMNTHTYEEEKSENVAKGYR